jgi:hypothetical protein
MAQFDSLINKFLENIDPYILVVDAMDGKVFPAPKYNGNIRLNHRNVKDNAWSYIFQDKTTGKTEFIEYAQEGATKEELETLAAKLAENDSIWKSRIKKAKNEPLDKVLAEALKIAAGDFAGISVTNTVAAKHAGIFDVNRFYKFPKKTKLGNFAQAHLTFNFGLKKDEPYVKYTIATMQPNYMTAHEKWSQSVYTYNIHRSALENPETISAEIIRTLVQLNKDTESRFI